MSENDFLNWLGSSTGVGISSVQISPENLGSSATDLLINYTDGTTQTLEDAVPEPPSPTAVNLDNFTITDADGNCYTANRVDFGGLSLLQLIPCNN